MKDGEHVIPIAWGVEVPTESGPDMLLHLTQRELFSNIQATTELCINTVAQTYGLDEGTIDVMRSKLSGVEVVLMDEASPTELAIDYRKDLYVGPAVLAVANSAEIIPVRDSEGSRIILTLRSIAAEYDNLTSAFNGIQKLTGENPDLVLDEGSKDLEGVASESRRKEVAISLAFARQLLRQGLLPDGIQGESLDPKYGLSEWLEKCQAQLLDKILTKKDKGRLGKVYSADKLAVKNLRRTVWTELFYEILGVDPEVDPPFYMLYLSPALGQNSEYNLTYNEAHTFTINRQETREALAKIFAPTKTKKTKK